MLCTANQCRSPTAEALLRVGLERRGVSGHVHSAGLMEGGFPATSRAVATLAEMGLDISGHVSRTVTPEMLREADVVITMTLDHVRQVVLTEAEAWPKTFTLKELVRRAELAGPRDPEVPFEVWVQQLSEGRRRADMVGSSTDSDVADPIGRSANFYRRTAEELAELLVRLIDVAWPGEGLRGDASEIGSRRHR